MVSGSSDQQCFTKMVAAHCIVSRRPLTTNGIIFRQLLMIDDVLCIISKSRCCFRKSCVCWENMKEEVAVVPRRSASNDQALILLNLDAHSMDIRCIYCVLHGVMLVTINLCYLGIFIRNNFATICWIPY